MASDARADKYQLLDQETQIKLRPEHQVGSIQEETALRWLAACLAAKQ